MIPMDYWHILASSARLAQSIVYDSVRQQQGKPKWVEPRVYLLNDFLDEIMATSYLAGHLTSPPPVRLSTFVEEQLWHSIIQADMKNADTLLDIQGLCEGVMQANDYSVRWRLSLSHQRFHSRETSHFIRWQEQFRKRCQTLGALESSRYLEWQLDGIATGVGDLPQTLMLAGFEHANPQENRLKALLIQRGITLKNYATQQATQGAACCVELPNKEAECRMAVAWARQRIQENPQAQIAIVSTSLADDYYVLHDLLEDAFHETGISYNCSLGTPLAQHAIIQSLLHWFTLVIHTDWEFSVLSSVVRSPFLSFFASATVAAQLDSFLREQLPLRCTQQNVLHTLQRSSATSSQLYAQLQSAIQALPSHTLLPSEWLRYWQSITRGIWLKNYPLNSTEYQLVQKWQNDVLSDFSRLDILRKKLDAKDALSCLKQLCNQTIFQVKTSASAGIQVIGIQDILSAPLEAIWVLGMNDHIWPPPPRPNPFIPHELQRQAGIPYADNLIQKLFADTIEQRLLHSAQRIVFSSSLFAGARALRPSVLLQTLPEIPAQSLPCLQTRAEYLYEQHRATIEELTDEIAPPMPINSQLSGGVFALRAQAICPAWAFYRYRLHAKPLPTLEEGISIALRGNLLHAIMAKLWQQFSYDELYQVASREACVKGVVTEVCQRMLGKDKRYSDQRIDLEAEVLQARVLAWLGQAEFVDDRRFVVMETEKAYQVTVQNINIGFRVDRIECLEQPDSVIVVDYKSGKIPDISSWGADRILEPQLPFYAIFATDKYHISGVAFAQLREGDYAWMSVSSHNFDELPKSTFKWLARFTGWDDLCGHWQKQLSLLVQELQQGVASVRIYDESLLQNCDVLPLLRLFERQSQLELSQINEDMH